jgi:hypothetical protein
MAGPTSSPSRAIPFVKRIKTKVKKKKKIKSHLPNMYLTKKI